MTPISLLQLYQMTSIPMMTSPMKVSRSLTPVINLKNELTRAYRRGNQTQANHRADHSSPVHTLSQPIYILHHQLQAKLIQPANHSSLNVVAANHIYRHPRHTPVML